MKIRKAMMGVVMCLPCVAVAEDMVLVAFGDSLTQGYGLAQEAGFVAQLQGWLDDQGVPVNVINAGVSGDTTAGGAARIAWTLTPDVDAMIVTLGGNDVLRGVAPEVSRANLSAVLQVAQDMDVHVLLVGMQAPGNFGPEYKIAFDAIYPELAAEFKAMHAPSFFAGLNVEGDDIAQAQAFMQPDGIHPNAEGVARIVEGLGPSVLQLISRAQE